MLKGFIDLDALESAGTCFHFHIFLQRCQHKLVVCKCETNLFLYKHLNPNLL